MRHKLNTIWKIAFLVSLCLIVGGLSGYITQAVIPTWYANLQKPFFTPPNWLFGPVWTLLYLFMGIAAGLVWSKNDHTKTMQALSYFLAQLTINALWSGVFFGLKSPGFAIVVIALLIYLILKTIKLFSLVYPSTVYLLYPYLIWVIFASLLNLSIYFLNF